MSRDEYWFSSMQEMLSDMGKDFTDEEIDDLVDGIKGTLQNESTYRGWEHIPNPLETEIRELKRTIEKERHAADMREIEMEKKIEEEIRWGNNRADELERQLYPNKSHLR